MAELQESRIEITNTSTGVPELANIVYTSDVFHSLGFNTSFAVGTLIARASAGPAAGKLIEFFEPEDPAGSATAVGVLGYAIEDIGSGVEIGIQYIASGSVRLDEISAAEAANNPLSAAALDGLRSVGIIPIGTNELLELDNQ